MTKGALIPKSNKLVSAMGSRSKYCPETVEAICDHVRNGLSYRDSAHLAGISEELFYRWQRKIKADGSSNHDYHIEFVEALKRAEFELKEKLLAGILETAYSKAPNTWQARAWMLERRWRDEFSLRTEVTGRSGEGLKIELVAPYLSTRQVQPKMVTEGEVKALSSGEAE